MSPGWLRKKPFRRAPHEQKIGFFQTASDGHRLAGCAFLQPASWLALGALIVLACGGEKRPREASPAPAPMALPAPAPAPAIASAPRLAPSTAVPARAGRPQDAELDPTLDELPLAEDFAAEAARQITKQNYKRQLDALEQELRAEK